MKVLQIYKAYFPDTPGGLQEAIRQISLHTSKHGVESKIFCLSKNPLPKKIKTEEGEIIRSKSWFSPGHNDMGLIDSFLEFRALVKWADILHFHFPWPFADLLYLFSFIRKKSVMTYHSDVVGKGILSKLYNPLMKFMLNRMDIIVATSPRYLDSSKVLKNIKNKKKLKYISLGLDKKEYQKHENEIDDKKILNKFKLKKNKYFLFIGVLRKYKGLDFLFPASNLVDFKIAIAGATQPGDLDTGNFYIEESKKYKNISMIGEVSNTEKICLIKNSKGLVLPSHLRSEAFGIVLLEAAIYGKPLVSCEIETGTSFANLDNYSGIVVNPEDPTLLANAMKKIYLNEELATKFGNNARKRFDDLFTADKMGSSYLNVYKKLIDKDNKNSKTNVFKGTRD